MAQGPAAARVSGQYVAPTFPQVASVLAFSRERVIPRQCEACDMWHGCLRGRDGPFMSPNELDCVSTFKRTVQDLRLGLHFRSWP